MLSFLIELLVDCYRGENIFVFNKKEVKFGLKDMAISGLRIVNPRFIPKEELTFRDRYFAGVKQVIYQETNQTAFWAYS